MVDSTRVRFLNTQSPGDGPVVYIMQRDQRSTENWALLFAAAEAKTREVPLLVLFVMTLQYGHSSSRQYQFMLRGLKETAADLKEHNISFTLRTGNVIDQAVDFVKQHKAGEVVVDFHPFSFERKNRQGIADSLSIRVSEVDAHNIVPCWVASSKAEFAAHTFRPKVHRLLTQYLTTFPALPKMRQTVRSPKVDWNALSKELQVETVSPVTWLTAGTEAGKKVYKKFASERLSDYATTRNDPNEEGVSNLSPYLRFGHISAQWVAYTVNQLSDIDTSSKAAFLEELVVRRELTDNFCLYTPNYDQVSAAHEWAQKTIAKHATDVREYLYSQAQFEFAKTHDDLWNAMQTQLLTEGKLHGWCRMYWAKKILEWTPDAQTAIDTALYLNDKYELDGTDPNGIVGVMWSICGVHDRAWAERPVFGKIRYMNYNGAKRKFAVKTYIERYQPDPTLFS